MKKIPLLALTLVLSSLPVLAQSSSYSLDNFDLRNGVRVQEAPAKPQPAAKLAGRKHVPQQRTSADKMSIDNTLALSQIRPTVLFTDSTNAISSSLRGYTTGDNQVDGYLIDAGSRNGVDPLLLYSVMHQESSFKSHAVSPKGARGLMQLMPGTAARYGVTNIFDARQNIEGGARYLHFLLDRFNGDVNLALAGYNAGEGAVDKYGWRIPPYTETQEYVRRISRRYSMIQDPSSAMYARPVNRAQLTRLQANEPPPLTVYERTVSTVRLPDGKLQLMSQ